MENESLTLSSSMVSFWSDILLPFSVRMIWTAKGAGLRTYFFEKDPWNFCICHFNLGLKIPEALPQEIPQNFITTPIRISMAKNKGNSLWFFLIPPWNGNSTYFFSDPWNFQILFFQGNRKFHVLNNCFLDLFWNSPILSFIQMQNLFKYTID